MAMDLNETKKRLEIEQISTDIEQKIENIILTRKKNMWYEVTLILAGTAAIVTFTKLFL